MNERNFGITSNKRYHSSEPNERVMPVAKEIIDKKEPEPIQPPPFTLTMDKIKSFAVMTKKEDDVSKEQNDELKVK